MIFKDFFDLTFTTSDLMNAYNLNSTPIPLTTNEASDIKTTLGQFLHKDMYLNILDSDGLVLETGSEEYNEIIFQLKGCILHRIKNLVNTFRNFIDYEDLEQGKSVQEVKFNPIDEDNATTKLPTLQATINYNKYEINTAQTNAIIDAYRDGFQDIQEEIEYYLETIKER